LHYIHTLHGGRQKWDTPIALDEARAIARADPKREKARLKREADRDTLVAFREKQARDRLTPYQYTLRVAYATARKAKRLADEAKLKAAAVEVALFVHDRLENHVDGWTHL